MHWYRYPGYNKPLARIREELHPLGIMTKRTIGRVHYWYDDDAGPMKEIGDLVVRPDGSIEVWPYNGATENDLRVLYGSADEAFRNKPCKATNWSHVRDPRKGKSYWRSSVCVQADEDDQMFNVVMAARTAQNVAHTAWYSAYDAQREVEA